MFDTQDSFAWFDAYDHITKSICIPSIDLDGAHEITVYLEGEVFNWGEEVLKHWNGLGFDEAIPLDMAFLYR